MQRCGVLMLCFGAVSVLSGQVRQSVTQSLHGVKTAAESSSPLTVKAIAAGVEHSIALASDGTVWEWGARLPGLPFGEAVASGDATGRAAPTRVIGLNGVVAVAGGENYALARATDRELPDYPSAAHPLFCTLFGSTASQKLRQGARNFRESPARAATSAA